MADINGIVTIGASNTPGAATVLLFNEAGDTIVASTTSDPVTGAYSFTGLAAGTYRVAVMGDGAYRSKMYGPCAADVDPYFANVVSLLNMEGADGGTTFADSTGARVWAPSGSVHIDTALGYNAALFDGSGDYISTPYVAADFDWWTSDYTIEAWIIAASFTNWSYSDGTRSLPLLVGCAAPNGTTNYWSFGPLSGGAVKFYYWNGSPNELVATGAALSANVLHHIAMCKNSGGIHLAVNGVVSPPVAVNGTPLSSGSGGVVMTLGQINNRSINGRVRALRITKGVARYTANFTPPTAPFPNS